jgi:hypothetical protein
VLTTPGRHRAALTALAASATLVLTACGGDDPPRVRSGPQAVCETQGTVNSEPSSTLRTAVTPYLGGGERFKLEKQVTDTATVLMVRGDGGVAGRATLVKLEGGWAVTTVERCQR